MAFARGIYKIYLSRWDFRFMELLRRHALHNDKRIKGLVNRSTSCYFSFRFSSKTCLFY